MERIRTIVANHTEWDLYNAFFMQPDVERLCKFLARFTLWKKTLRLPGDIVELGVKKGNGFAQLLKLKEIFAPKSKKKVIGFDLFQEAPCAESVGAGDDGKAMQEFYGICNVDASKASTG